jgi:ABC-type glycerol-3-phosphate transport system permease component
MIQLSKPTAERLQHSLVTLILILGGIPIVLPLVWLVLASVKTADRVLTEKPEWLPWVERYRVADADQSWSVRVLDRSREGTLGWQRIRPVGIGDEPYFYWPADQLETIPVTGYAAPIGSTKRTVSAPQPADQPNLARVRQLGTERRVAVRPEDVRAESTQQTIAQLLGQEVTVEVNVGRPGRTLQITEPSPPFYLADTLIRGRGATAVSAVIPGIELPIEILEHYGPAGVSRVRFIAGPPVQVDPAHLTVERRMRTRYWLRIGDRDTEVKPTRTDAAGQPLEVAVLGEPKEWLVPAAEVTAVTRQEHRIHWLGQTLTVAPRPDVAAPAGTVAVQTISPADTAVIAADRVQLERTLAPQWANYVRVFGAEPLHKYVLNTLFITALCILGNVLSCGLVGYAFARLQFRARNALFVVVLATMMLPATITFLPTYILYVKIGWLDTFYPLIVPSFLATAAFFVFLYRQYFMTIPLDLEDAARIDGCGPLGTFWHIMLPMARPAVVTVVVFTFMGAWNDFMGPLLYLNTDEYQTLAYGLFSFKTSFGYKFPHYMMAASTLMMIPTVVVFFLAQNAFLRGIVVTGVKG